jgi:hypothetical protein
MFLVVMSVLPNDPQPKENRTVHGLLAIAVLVFAQVNLFFNPEDVLPQPSAKAGRATADAGAERKKVSAIEDSAGAAPFLKVELPTQMEKINHTAFNLAKQGTRYLPKSSQGEGKVVRIVSENHEQGLEPSNWRVVYFDESAKTKTIEVYFSDGEMTRVSEPQRFLGLFSRSARKPMEQTLLKIDSDEALAIALRRTGLNEATVERSEFKLETGKDGLPVWKITFWGRVQKRVTNMGQITILAHDGTVVQNKIKAAPVPDRLARAESKILPEQRL